MQSEFTFKAIAFFSSSKTKNLEAGSQGALDPGAKGVIDLGSMPEWSSMLADLDTFTHLWIVFVFHQHQGLWRPKVLPPRSEKKVGVFASRSPYRPSPIGISAVKIDRIEDSRIYVSGHDLIDGTPILDIKPYLTYADSFPEASAGWLAKTKEWQIVFTVAAQEQINFLFNRGLTEFEAAIRQQLRFNPTDKRRKRVRPQNNATTKDFIYSYRTWRVKFELSEPDQVTIQSIHSGYSQDDLTEDKDPHRDKSIHRDYVRLFSAISE